MHNDQNAHIYHYIFFMSQNICISKLCGTSNTLTMDKEGSVDDEDDASNDDIVKNLEDESCFNMGMSREEKIFVRRPWCTSLIIKFIGRRIGYQYLLKRLQAMWRIQSSITLIDLLNNFFIVCFRAKEDYDTALFDGTWLVGDHYLHVQK